MIPVRDCVAAVWVRGLESGVGVRLETPRALNGGCSVLGAPVFQMTVMGR